MDDKSLQVAHLALLSSFPFFSVSSASFILSVIMVKIGLLLNIKNPILIILRSWWTTISPFRTLERIIIHSVRWVMMPWPCFQVASAVRFLSSLNSFFRWWHISQYVSGWFPFPSLSPSQPMRTFCPQWTPWKGNQTWSIEFISCHGVKWWTP